MFTESRRWLERVAHELAPADGVDVWGLVVHPLVELVLPAVEVDEQQAADTLLHSGDAHKARLHQVHCLQLHVGGEAVAWVVLKEDKSAAFHLRTLFLYKSDKLCLWQPVAVITPDFLSYCVEQLSWCSFCLGLLQVVFPSEGARIVTCQTREKGETSH